MSGVTAVNRVARARFGYWTPIWGGWLRNIADEQTPATWQHIAAIAQSAEASGYDLTLVPELNLNDIKGQDAPALDAWTIATALAAVTERLEIIAAIRPGYYNPALIAKRAATIAEISGDRFSLNIVSAWWAEEARQYGAIFSEHDDRYQRSIEFTEILRGLWSEHPFSYSGDYYQLDGTHFEPKPARTPRIYAGGESEGGREAISRFADAYLTHGGTVDELAAKVRDLNARRERIIGTPFASFGMAAYAIVRDTEAEAQQEFQRITTVSPGSAGYGSYQDFVSKSQLETAVDLRDYSVSNRGLRPEFVGTPEQVAERVHAFTQVGVEVFLLQFSPHLEEQQRFAEQVIPLVREIEAGAAQPSELARA